MSLIIAVNNENHKFMSADRGAYYNDTSIKLLSKNSKIIEYEFEGEKYILGGVGSWCWVDTVFEGFYNFLENEDLIDNWSLRKAMKELMDDYDDIENELTSEIMLLTKDTLFIIGSDCSVSVPEKEFWAIGAGQSYAIGFLDACSHEFILTKAIMNDLFEKCSKYSMYVVPEYDIIEI